MAGIAFQSGVQSMGFDMAPSGGVASGLFNLSASGAVDSTVTPFGSGYSWKVTNGAFGWSFGSNPTTNIYHFRFQVSSIPGAGVLLYFWDATAGAAQCNLWCTTAGQLGFYLGATNGTLIGSLSSTGALPIGSWCHVMVTVTCGTGSGFVECKINGATVITASSVTTKNTANTWISGIKFNSISSGNAWYDDIVILDATGSAPLNAYLGQVQVKGDVPNANSAVGGRNAFTPTNPQNDNHLNVGNIPANTAQYNADLTPGDYDMFRFPSLTALSVLFLNEWAEIELDAAGSRTVGLNCYSGGTDSLGTAFAPSAGSYLLFNNVSPVDPNTSSAWTVSNAGSAELGVKVVS